MNQFNEKEIDLLLRRHARRGAMNSVDATGASGDGAAQSAGAHLDADELNSYAENALPQAARARYASHLVECDECRKVVTELSLSANVPLKDESAADLKTIGRRSWGEWLASLFASPALRFGTLALLLVGIAGLALIVMRQQKHEESGLVARNNGRASTVEEQPSLNHANSSVADTAKTATTDSSSANASTSSARVVSEPTPQNAPAGTLDDTRQQSSVSSTKAQSPAQVGGVTGDLSQSVNGQRGANAERPENQPAAPPQASAPATTAGATAQANEADELRARTAEEQRRQDERAYGRGNSAGAAGAAAPSSRAVAQTEPQDRAQSGALARPRRRGSGEDRESPDATTKNNVDIGEIRRVAGHQFRRQGSAWVDTAYRSSMSTTNVSRGSDRYRSLVADAPEIRTIADQLGGEIIIVSNGRAYKIH